MKHLCFTVDDNIRFLQTLTAEKPDSMFDHPYLAMLRRLHLQLGIKVQLNLFYRIEGFTLAQMTDRYAEEWRENAHWLKLSFHSWQEDRLPYQTAGYERVCEDVCAVQREILRFASEESLAKTTTVHYCQTTSEGLRALADNGVRGLLGLFGTDAAPQVSYGVPASYAARLRLGEMVMLDGMTYAPIAMVVNCLLQEELAPALESLYDRALVCVMIHEQYFYADYKAYQPDFEEKLALVLGQLRDRGYESCFLEELL